MDLRTTSWVQKTTRIVCVQVRTRPIRDGLNAALRGLLTVYFEHLKYNNCLSVLVIFDTLKYL